VTGELAGVVVADFDGEEGVKLMRKWGIKAHVRTGSGGFHWYALHPGWRVKTMNAKSCKGFWPWPGLDIRGDGGFAVLLGRNKDGPYEQLRELVPDPFDALPEEVRTFLLNRSEKKDAAPMPQARPRHRSTTSNKHRVSAELLVRKALGIVPRSGRNNSGFWLAAQLRDNGYSDGEAESAMRDYRSRVPSTNMKGQREPYEEREMVATLRQAYSRPARQPWGRRNSSPHADGAPAPSRERGRRGDTEAVSKKKGPPPPGSANSPKSIDLYVDPTGEPQVAPTEEPLPNWKYAKVPREVAVDRGLKRLDLSVYCMLAGSVWQGNVARIGQRLIARCLHMGRRHVDDSLERLEARGHVKAAITRHGQRGAYMLTSPVFNEMQRAGIQQTAVGPQGRLRLVTVSKDQSTAWMSTPRSIPRQQSGRKEHR
jgi:hypothetical protein